MSQTFTEEQYLKNAQDSFLAGKQAERNRAIHFLEDWQQRIKPQDSFIDDRRVSIWITLEAVKLHLQGLLK
jgi:hypothetical protein